MFAYVNLPPGRPTNAPAEDGAPSPDEPPPPPLPFSLWFVLPFSFSFSRALFQIVLIDIVFSFDSILTAVGMTNGVPYALFIMIAAVVIAISIMIGFADPVSQFVNKHPSLQILGLSFLLLIGFMLITEAASLSETVIFGSSISTIPKGYLYFAILFSLGVEMLNMRIKKAKRN